MKKIGLCILLIAMCTGLVACGKESENTSSKNSQASSTNSNKDNSEDKSQDKKDDKIILDNKEPIELTLDNIYDYIAIDTEVLSCEFGPAETDLFGTDPSGISGKAEVSYTIRNLTNRQFDYVTLVLEVYTKILDEPEYHGWEFEGGYKRGFTDKSDVTTDGENGVGYNANLTFSGGFQRSETLKLKIYSDATNVQNIPKLDNIYVRILSVKGSIGTKDFL